MIFLPQELVPTCSDCGSAISGPYFTLEGGTIVCEQHYKVLKAGSLSKIRTHKQDKPRCRRTEFPDNSFDIFRPELGIVRGVGSWQRERYSKFLMVFTTKIA